jgi:membrane fusion protein, multidrug efflux system
MVQRGIENKVPEDPPAAPDLREAPTVVPARNRKRTRNIAIGVVIIIAILLFLLVRHRTAAQAKANSAAGKGKQAVPVAVAPVQVQDVPVYLDGLGNVNALSTVTVKTRLDGQLLQFNFQDGQLVHAGEELAVIDPRPSLAALAQAQANEFKDTAALENARRDLARYSELYKTGVMSQQQYDTQLSQVRVAEGAVKSDAAQVQNAQLNVSYCHIKAPITGRVGIRFVDPGNMVHASDANGLLVITQMQPIAVLFTLPEDQLPAVVQHMRSGTLVVEAWNRDLTQKLATGRLLTIDNQIDPNTGTFRVKAIFDNSDGSLYPNQFINARLQVEIRRGALTIPSAAIQHGSQGNYVYVVQPDQTAEMRVVQVVLSEGTTSVVDGVKAGEQVVTDGADKLQPKGKVEIGGGRGAAGRGRPAGGGGQKARKP